MRKAFRVRMVTGDVWRAMATVVVGVLVLSAANVAHGAAGQFNLQVHRSAAFARIQRVDESKI
jgi:hypothetical protein